MGGKDFIVVADDANIDEAAKGIVAAAFGYQGQKCSACSRLIVDEKVHDELVEKILVEAKKIKMGPVKDNSNKMGPVVSANAFKDIKNYIEIGKKEGDLILGGGI